MKLIAFTNDSINKAANTVAKLIGDKNMQVGEANGYVAVPKGHPLHGISCEDVNIDVHGELTFSGIPKGILNGAEFIDDPDGVDFSEYWAFGFDTLHSGDTPESWNKDKVIKETLKLKELLSEKGKAEETTTENSEDDATEYVSEERARDYMLKALDTLEEKENTEIVFCRAKLKEAIMWMDEYLYND